MKSTLSIIATAFLLSLAAPMPSFAQTDGISAASAEETVDKRRKPRVPGGSGCDDPEDLVEHPECR